MLRDSGTVVLAETIAKQTQRLYCLLDETKLDAELYNRLVVAEEAIYSNESDPMVNWNAEDLRVMFESAGLVIEVKQEQLQSQLHITSTLIERWFGTKSDRSSYATYLSRLLSPQEVDTVLGLFNRYLLNQTVPWSSARATVQASL